MTKKSVSCNVRENPFPYSDTNRRFYTFDYYMRKIFGKKCAKVPVDAGFTCPNIDGKISRGGCTYCVLATCTKRDLRPIEEQFDEKLKALRYKWPDCIGIPYFQDYTNTYAPVEKLNMLYKQALALPGAAGLHIATRADCLPEPVLDLLEEISRNTYLVVELGLQTVSDITAEKINRGHSFAEFLTGYNALLSRGINVCIHIINGLPGETGEMMLKTAEVISVLHPHSIKIHLLHIMRNTRIASEYESGSFDVMTLDEYTNGVVSQLELLPPDVVIGRVTGDGTADNLIAPLWSRKKFVVMNEIDKEFVRRNSMQGIKWKG